MKYTTYNVQQLVHEGRKKKSWQARAKYKDADGMWKEVHFPSEMLCLAAKHPHILGGPA